VIKAFRDRVLILLFWILLCLIFLCLHALKYARTIRFLSVLSPNPEGSGVHRARFLSKLIKRAAEGPIGPDFRCLHESICLWWLLRFLGIRSSILTGVRSTTEDGVLLHAWVEVNGQVVNDDPENIRSFRRLWGRLEPSEIGKSGRK
jgi:hypothetical protein